VSHGAVPGFVRAPFAPILACAAPRWNVSATLHVARVLGLMTGAGAPLVAGDANVLAVRLVR
jgi:hypothetical protein